RDENAAGETRVVCEEGAQDRARVAAEDLHVRPGAGPGARDDVGTPVAVHVARGHGDAAAERRVVGEEGGGFGPGRATEYLHVRTAARAGAGHDVRVAIAVDVAGGNVDPTGEARGVG